MTFLLFCAQNFRVNPHTSFIQMVQHFTRICNLAQKKHQYDFSSRHCRFVLTESVGGLERLPNENFCDHPWQMANQT